MSAPQPEMAQLFAERLRLARKMRKMSQRDLGVKAGIPFSSIGHFETGMRTPTIETLRRLGQALNVSTDYLLGHTLNFATETTGARGDYFSEQVTEARRFFLKHNQAPHHINVLSGGIETCTKDYVIRRDAFPYYCLEYVLRGHGEVRLDGESHALTTGRVFFYRPYMPHEIVGDPDDPLVKYFVVISGDGVEAALEASRIGVGGVVQVFPPDVLTGLFDELVAVGMRAGSRCETMCAKMLECLTLELADVVAPIEDDGVARFETYQRCRRMVQDNFLRLSTSAEIAGVCGIEESELVRLFRQFCSHSPEQYLLRLKMNYAAGCLQNPDARVSAVADSVGYGGDPYRFASAFNAVLGLSPDMFREMSRAS